MQGYKKNKRPVALVTGFSSGIGLAYSKYLAKNNWELELIAQNPEKAKKAFESLSYPHSKYHLCDLSKPEDLDNVVKVIKEPNLIVANAGITKYGVAGSINKQEKRDLFYLLCNGVIDLIEEFIPSMIDQGEGTKPYQGLSPLNGRSLSDSAETYFAQSEQLPTVFHLKFDKIKQTNMEATWRAGGIMVQHLPTSNFQASEENNSDPSGLLSSHDLLNGDNAENWNRINYHLDTIEDLELIGPSVTPSELLVRLFHEEQPRIFDAQSVRFGCSCSEDRVRQSLSIYSAKDISKMITADGLVTVDCQFCGAPYELDPKAVGFEAINSGT